jgi:Fur family ferric uptake transcriptional regulator
MRLTANRIAGILRSHGYKLTPQRHVVLKVIAASQGHLTPEEIYNEVRQESPGIGLVTVYRTLDLLLELDLLCQLHTGDRSRSYIMKRPTEHHHHLVCSGCGKTVDFSDCNLHKLEDRLTKDTGFTIDGHLLEIYGRCRDCRVTVQS